MNQMVLLGIHPKRKRVVFFEGSNTQTFPITFEGIIGDSLTVKSEIHRMWFEMWGWKWIVAESDSQEGQSIQRVADQITEDNITETLETELEVLGDQG